MEKTTKQQFKKEYTDLRDKFISVKEKLVQLKKELVSLRHNAKRLFKKGEHALYTEISDAWLKPEFGGLNKCMTNLIDWAETWDIVAEAVDVLPVKRRAGAQRHNHR